MRKADDASAYCDVLRRESSARAAAEFMDGYGDYASHEGDAID